MSLRSRQAIPGGLLARIAELFPDETVQGVEPLGADAGADGAASATGKGLGYGRPMRVELERRGGGVRRLVFHVAGANDYGHDRRADRAAEQLLAWDTFPLIPGHARAVDVGAIGDDGRLISLARTGELYLITEWAEGETYAEDLRRIAASGEVTPLDLARVDALADELIALHRMPGTRPGAYVRAWRDLLGSGEGIAGLVDGYGEGAPGASLDRLHALERQCLEWRQRFKHRTERLRRTHGDYHPFNLVFARGEAMPTLLDTSRGSEGEPADDVTCLAINFLFFGLPERARFKGGLGVLWSRFWERTLAAGDTALLEVAAPFFTWRALVLCNPGWYPHLATADRERLLSLAERGLASPRFDPAWGPEAMR